MLTREALRAIRQIVPRSTSPGWTSSRFAAVRHAETTAMAANRAAAAISALAVRRAAGKPVRCWASRSRPAGSRRVLPSTTATRAERADADQPDVCDGGPPLPGSMTSTSPTTPATSTCTSRSPIVPTVDSRARRRHRPAGDSARAGRAHGHRRRPDPATLSGPAGARAAWPGPTRLSAIEAASSASSPPDAG